MTVPMALPTPTKIVCVGRNYRAHAAELGNEVPAEPLLFLKPPSALIGDGESIVLPDGVGRVDYEGEIGVVVGRRASHVTEVDALAHVAAYLPLNDVTARDLQRRDSQWTRAKGFDTFCPVGAPLAAVADPASLTVTTRVNGVERQRGCAADLVFGIPFLISYISRIMTLEPGDIVATGTPEGVGPLQLGDIVEVELVGHSTLRNPVAAGPAGGRGR